MSTKAPQVIVPQQIGDGNIEIGANFDSLGIEDENHAATTGLDDHHHHSVKVYVSVVHHASLSATHLLGKYDESMQWVDGFLMRKLREVDEIIHKPAKDAHEKKLNHESVHM